MEQFFEHFSRQVASHPDAVAVCDGAFALTYAELDAASDAVAHMLTANGVGAGEPVGYLAEPSVDRVPVFLGLLKAGTPQIMLDPRNPIPANRDLTDNGEATAIIVDSVETAAMAATLGLPAMRRPAPWPTRATTPPFNRPQPAPEATAYFRFTSGSTGKPKGMAIPRSVVDFTNARLLRAAPMERTDRTAIFNQFWPNNILITLSIGATLDFFDLQGRGGQALVLWMQQRQITQIRMFAAVFRAMQIDRETRLPDLRLMSLSGEPLLRADAEHFDRITDPGARLINSYSATEYSVTATFEHRNGDPIDFDSMPLGRPVEPEYFRLLDADGHAVAPGEEGEIVITSPHVLKSYHRDPERSARVFRPLPELGGQIVYFTGDRARFGPDGLLHSVGRADDQIKIRGYTLRPSEIEQMILDIPGIKRAAVVGFDGPHGIRRLACHYTVDAEPPPGAAEIRRHLRALAPAYMTPTAYTRHTSLPTTASGKIMRRALSALPQANAASRRGLDAARTLAERRVVTAWIDILGHGDFDIEDDFFDVGGDSLQAMSMLVALERDFATRLPLESLILEGATVALLAERFAPPIDARPRASLVPMNRATAGPPVFALHVMGGHLSDYLEFAHAWDGGRQLIGVSPRGLDSRYAPDTTAAAIGAHAAEVIRAVQPVGPYHLVGYSAGGSYAFETARALSKGGAEIALALIDPPAPGATAYRQLRSIWRAAKHGNPLLALQRARDVTIAAAGRTVRPGQIDEAHLRALLEYAPAPLALDHVLYIKTPANSAKQEKWARLLGPFHITEIHDAAHDAMMRDGNGAALARIVDGWLRVVEPARRPTPAEVSR